MNLNDLRLYLITDRSLFAGRNKFLNAVENALTGGVKALQLREKELPDSELIELGQKLRSLTSNYDARLFINSRADIAKKIGADGVHLTEAVLYTQQRSSASNGMVTGDNFCLIKCLSKIKT